MIPPKTMQGFYRQIREIYHTFAACLIPPPKKKVGPNKSLPDRIASPRRRASKMPGIGNSTAPWCRRLIHLDLCHLTTFCFQPVKSSKFGSAPNRSLMKFRILKMMSRQLRSGCFGIHTFFPFRLRYQPHGLK